VRSGIHPADRKILIGAGIVLVALTAGAFLVTPAPAEEDRGIATTYSSGSGGARAAFLLLKELGYNVARWEQEPTWLAGEAPGTTFILAAPLFPSSSEERIAVHTFIRRGGRVILAGPVVGFLADPPSLGRREGHETEWESFSAVHPSPLTRGAPQITMAGGGQRASSKAEGFVPLYGDEKGAVVVTYRAGAGEVIWLSQVTPLTNAGIAQAQNLELLLNAVGQPGGRLLWDEYYHGYRGSLWSYLARTPVPWGLAQLAVVLVAVVLTYSRRRGPVMPPYTETRLSPVEFVETLGGLYHRARASGPAVGIAYRRFRYLLAKRLGLSPATPVEQLHHAARERLGAKHAGLYDAMLKCDRLERHPELEDNDAAALKLVQAIEHYARLMKLEAEPRAPRAPQEPRATATGKP
jgi:hypothetical protein